MHDFLNSVSVVVGGTSGIGEKVASDLCAFGSDVILVGRNAEKLDRLTNQLPRSHGLQADVSSPAECRRLATKIGGEVESIDFLVLSVGNFEQCAIDEINQEHLDAVFSANVFGPLLLLRAILPLLKKGRGKSIVAISSILAHFGAAETTAYAASKGALSAAIRALAIELATHSIRANSVSPGHVETPMIEGLLQNPRERREIERQYPAGRIGLPADVSQLVTFLLSRRASWITGCDYQIDGGRSALI